MKFTARIVRGSPLWRAWREHRRVGGTVGGVHFSWIPGDDYVAARGLSAAEVGMLQGSASVQLETVDVMAPAMIPPMSKAEADPLPYVVDPMVPDGVVEFRDRDNRTVGRIVNVGTRRGRR